MIVTVRNWTLLRPMRVAWRAHKVSKSRQAEVRPAQTKRGVLADYESMLTHAVDLMFRNAEN